MGSYLIRGWVVYNKTNKDNKPIPFLIIVSFRIWCHVSYVIVSFCIVIVWCLCHVVYHFCVLIGFVVLHICSTEALSLMLYSVLLNHILFLLSLA